MPVRGRGPAMIQRGSLSRRRTARIALRVPHAVGPRPETVGGPAARSPERAPRPGREQYLEAGDHTAHGRAVMRRCTARIAIRKKWGAPTESAGTSHLLFLWS